MARDIKFRAKRLDNGGWIYGDLHLRTPHAHIHSEVGRKAFIDTDTIGQFTGLLDKNGKEIYEGDIIGSEKVSGRVVSHKIEYDVENAMFVAKPLQGLDFDYCHIYKHWICRYGKEVIGNIHDNPELLNNK